MAAKILLVEDEPEVAGLIEKTLSAEGHAVVRAGSCAEGWSALEGLRPDLVVLDVGLPDGTGLSLCRRIRSHPQLCDTPVIVLTAKGGVEDKLGGLDAGADRYLVKPLQIPELKLWAAALLRRLEYERGEGGVLRVEDFVMDPRTRAVSAGGQAVLGLTRKEFDLLYQLVRHRPKVLSKDFLMSSVWDAVLRDNTIESHVRNLRAKLGPAASRIVTVPGRGYRFW